MNWQMIIVSLLVAAAGLYLARGAWRMWRGSGKSCGGSCKCDEKAAADEPRLIPVESVVLRSRPR